MIRAAVVAVTGLAVLSPYIAPGRLGVGATEFHLVLSRASVKAGRVEIELDNWGQDVHDLRIGGARVYKFPLTSPGARTTRTVRLLPGRYRLWCSVANHAQLGMRAVLRVRR